MSSPVIDSERLLLNPLEADDASHMFVYRSLPEICQYQNWLPQNEEEVAKFIKRNQLTPFDKPGSWYQLAIRLKRSYLAARKPTLQTSPLTIGQPTESCELIGDLGLHFLEDAQDQVELGITLSPKNQGKGYAKEAMTALLDFLFIEGDKHRVIGSVDPRNKASIGLLESIGFRKEAHFKQSLWFKGEWVDDLIYALLRDEWLWIRKSAESY